MGTLRLRQAGTIAAPLRHLWQCHSQIDSICLVRIAPRRAPALQTAGTEQKLPISPPHVAENGSRAHTGRICCWKQHYCAQAEDTALARHSFRCHNFERSSTIKHLGSVGNLDDHPPPPARKQSRDSLQHHCHRNSLSAGRAASSKQGLHVTANVCRRRHACDTQNL